MEAHLKTKYNEADIKLVSSGGGVFEITLNDELIFSKKAVKYINMADVFILSSKYEGLPNVLLEAQVLKKFIISSDCPTGPREILLNGKAGYLFKMRDYKNLAELIIKASKNINQTNKKAMVGYKNLHRFDYKVNLNKYYNIINRFL